MGKVNRTKEIYEKRIERFIPPITFCDCMAGRRCERNGEGGGVGVVGRVGNRKGRGERGKRCLRFKSSQYLGPPETI